MPTAKLSIKVVPRASADEIVGWLDGVLKVRVRAAPQGGEANAAVEALLAAELGLRRTAVKVTAGHGATRKRIEVEGLDAAEIDRRLRASTRNR